MKIRVYSHSKLAAKAPFKHPSDVIYISSHQSWQKDRLQVASLFNDYHGLWIVADDVDDWWLLTTNIKQDFRLISIQQLALVKSFVKQSLKAHHSLIISCNAGISRSGAIGWYAACQADQSVRDEFLRHYQNKLIPNANWTLALNHHQVNQSNWNKINRLRIKTFNIKSVDGLTF